MLRRTLAAAALLGASVLLAEEGVLEKTIAFPRDRYGELNLVYKKCTIRYIEPKNFPDHEDIEKARANDPKDTSWLWWQLDLENKGPENFKIKLAVEVLDKDGKIIKSSDRIVTIAGFEDESYRLWMRMLTLDAADAPKVRVRAQFVHNKKS